MKTYKSFISFATELKDNSAINSSAIPSILLSIILDFMQGAKIGLSRHAV